MKHSTQIDFATMIEDTLSDDAIDELFTQLLYVEPPTTLVHDILATVASLPQPEITAEYTWDEQEEPRMLDLLLKASF